ncbi:hypothetical protein EVAR_35714_1 [Eumeta japonica]|uniref:Uncharacterized protein n=1 Tax=Eumeta variegata TaxID=151549 RepID=A0A4C1VFC7_EUMVA|nr:hypothetical protein EVAR_35714_1 [Eumeta japonica]
MDTRDMEESPVRRRPLKCSRISDEEWEGADGGGRGAMKGKSATGIHTQFFSAETKWKAGQRAAPRARLGGIEIETGTNIEFECGIEIRIKIMPGIEIKSSVQIRMESRTKIGIKSRTGMKVDSEMVIGIMIENMIG